MAEIATIVGIILLVGLIVFICSWFDERDTNKVTRFEVIDWTGRAYGAHGCRIELSYQDGGRTLKVFVDER